MEEIKGYVPKEGDYTLHKDRWGNTLLSRISKVYGPPTAWAIELSSFEGDGSTGHEIGLGFLNPFTGTYFFANSHPIYITPRLRQPEVGDSAVIVDDDGYGETWIVVEAHHGTGTVRITHEDVEYTRPINKGPDGEWSLDDSRLDEEEPLIAFFPAVNEKPEPEYDLESSLKRFNDWMDGLPPVQP